MLYYLRRIIINSFRIFFANTLKGLWNFSGHAAVLCFDVLNRGDVFIYTLYFMLNDVPVDLLVGLIPLVSSWQNASAFLSTVLFAINKY